MDDGTVFRDAVYDTKQLNGQQTRLRLEVHKMIKDVKLDCARSAQTSVKASSFSRTKVIPHSNRINSDSNPDVCRIVAKISRIHCLVGVSHFAECRENRSVTV